MLILLRKMEKQLVNKRVLLIILCLLVTGSIGFADSVTIDLERVEDRFLSIGYEMPLLLIDTDGQAISGLELTPANLKVLDEGTQNFLWDTPVFESEIGIKIRGKSSRKFPKKQYRIEIWNKEGEDKDVSLLGMPKESDWVLYGPFKDKSLIRNALAFDIASKTMVYAPRFAYCEVFIVEDGSDQIGDRHFQGLYLLVEQIKRSDERVNLFQTFEELAETSFLASKDVPFYNDQTLLTYGRETVIYGRSLELDYPGRRVSDAQLTYISRVVSAFERALYASNYDRRGGYRDHIIVESFLDFYIINEFFRNTDAGVYSTYFSKNYGEKIRMGPVWDFNESMGNDLGTGPYYAYKGFYLNDDFWFERLMTDRNFVSDLIQRYRLLRQTYLSDDYLIDRIDAYASEIESARRRNYEKWPFELSNQVEALEATWVGYLGVEEEVLNEDIRTSLEMSYIRQYAGSAGQPEEILAILQAFGHLEEVPDEMAKTYDEEIESMKAFVINRGKWMDDNIEYLLRFTY